MKQMLQADKVFFEFSSRMPAEYCNIDRIWIIIDLAIITHLICQKFKIKFVWKQKC